MKKNYKFGVGVWKTIKNVLITVGIPGVLYLLNNLGEWMPKGYIPIAFPVASLIVYFIKNYIQNK